MTNQILKALEKYRGKGIFYDTVGPAAVGTGVARAAIDAEYSVPSAARELAGVIPTIMGEAPAPAESILAIGDIIGADFKGIPCEFPFPVAAGKLGAVDQLETTPMEFWPIHAPLKGTEDLNFGQEMCDANAGDAQAALTLVFLEKPSGLGQIYGKFSREIAGSTTAACRRGHRHQDQQRPQDVRDGRHRRLWRSHDRRPGARLQGHDEV